MHATHTMEDRDRYCDLCTKDENLIGNDFKKILTNTTEN